MVANADAIEYLDFYLFEMRYASGAVMLTGTWGCGKTHFLTQYLSSRRTRISAQHSEKPSDNKKGYFYCSLYGVTDLSHITDSFFLQQYPVIASGRLKFVGHIVSRAFNSFSGVDPASLGISREAIKKAIQNLRGEILVFDDFERSSIPISDIMGFINNCIEPGGAKVIIIANEKEVPADRASAYRKMKEKIISKSISIASNPKEVLGSVISEFEMPFLKEFVTGRIDDIHALIITSGIVNFRTIRSVLHDFERLVRIVDPQLIKSVEAMEKLLFCLIAMGLELRSGRYTKIELDKIQKACVDRLMWFDTKKPKSAELEMLDVLEQAYPRVDWGNPIIEPGQLGQFLETGAVNIDDVNKALRINPLVVGKAASPAWRNLWHWPSLTRSEYNTVLEGVAGDLEHQRIREPEEILHVTGIAIRIRENGANFPGSEHGIVTLMKAYIDGLRDRNLLAGRHHHIFLKSRKLAHESYGGLGYQAIETAEFQEVLTYLESAIRLVFDANLRLSANHLIGDILSEKAKYSRLYEPKFEDGDLGRVPFLHFVDPSFFAAAMIDDGAFNQELFSALRERYRDEWHDHGLEREYGWLSALEAEALVRADAATPPHKVWLNRRIKDNFDQIRQKTQPSDTN